MPTAASRLLLAPSITLIALIAGCALARRHFDDAGLMERYFIMKGVNGE